MTTFTALFAGKVLIPDRPVEWPVNQPLRVHVEPPGEPQEEALQRLAALAKRLPVTGGPPDGAAQHDHYLYGLLRRP